MIPTFPPEFSLKPTPFLLNARHAGYSDNVILISTNRITVLRRRLTSLTNQDFCSSLVEVKNDKDNSVHEGVPFPLHLSTENPFPSPLKHRLY